MTVTLAFRPYRRQFVRPLHTAHGLWRHREGLILQLRTAAGLTSYGEIAPIPWFGTETVAEAIAWLTSLQTEYKNLSLSDLSAIVERSPAHYSATRFGLGMAIAQLQGRFPAPSPPPGPEAICALLPAGASALTAWPLLWEQGHRTFKWKLGVQEVAQELSELEPLRRSLPPQAKLRLDANGGFSLPAAQQCLRCCDDLATQGLPIEFLEQPLPPQCFDDLLRLSQTYQTPLALDESVTGLAQLTNCHQRGWSGIFVVKGAIAGDPLALLNYCQRHQLQTVFSSVFETDLARQAVFAMAQRLLAPGDDSSSPSANASYALGFGVGHWLQPDDLDEPNSSLVDLTSSGEQLWQRLMGQHQPA